MDPGLNNFKKRNFCKREQLKGNSKGNNRCNLVNLGNFHEVPIRTQRSWNRYYKENVNLISEPVERGSKGETYLWVT